MEQIKKRKKFVLIKFFVLVLIFLGIMLFSASFPVTMELLDEKVTDILSLTGTEKDFKGFSKFSFFSKNVMNKAEYWLEVIKENTEKNGFDLKPVSGIKITCAAEFPAENRYITSYFGKREDPFSEKEDFHVGIDIAAEKGSDIVAAWPGKIYETGFDNIYGKYVVMEHSENFFTKYCHLSKISSEEKTFVNSGEKIGEAGSTGRSTGSHLHFEVIIEGRKIDPMECFEI